MTRSSLMKIQEITREYVESLKKLADQLDFQQIERVIRVLITAYQKNKTVYVIGNGGGASLASHWACDLAKNTVERVYNDREKRFKVIALTDSVPLLTAYANDLSFDDIFVQLLRNMIDKGDVLFAISGSGSSPNINKAVRYAKKSGAITIGLLGFGSGGKTGSLVDYKITVNSRHYGQIEGMHANICHLLAEVCYLLKDRGENDPNVIKIKPVSRAGNFSFPTLKSVYRQPDKKSKSKND